MKKEKQYKWGTIIPLIGGMTIGNMEATGEKPDFFVSYPAFSGNDKHIIKYCEDVPYYLIDPETNDFIKTNPEPEEDEKIINEGIDNESWEGIDFISSVCPCAGLSMMNTSTKEGSASARGSDAVQNEWMYKSSTFVLEKLKPKVLFGENAPGLFTKIGQGVVDKLTIIGEKYGYSFSMYKTSTVHHGIPQKRDRTFYFFWKDSTVPVFEYYRRERKKLAEYLAEVPKDAPHTDWTIGHTDANENPFIQYIKKVEGKNWRKAVLEHTTSINYIWNTKNLENMIKWAEEDYNPTEQKKKDKIIKYLNHVKYKASIGKGWWDATPKFYDDYINAVIARTIATAMHPTEERNLNIRECMHLMGLPNDFTLENIKQFNHISQNVPVPTARDMTTEVIKFIKGEAILSNEKFMRQNNARKGVPITMPSKSLF